MYVLFLYLNVHGTYYVCTEYVPVHTFFLFSEPRFTGFRGVQRDANMQQRLAVDTLLQALHVFPQ